MTDHVEPVAPIGEEPPVMPAVPVDAASSSERARAAAAARQAALQPPTGTTVGDATAHEQLEHPVVTPAGVETRSTVHDAAMHGNRIAAAIERQHAEPSERAQQLAGAAASAGSGQAAVVDLEGAPDPGLTGDPVVRRESVTKIHDDPDRRDPRSIEEQLSDDDLRA